MRMMTGVGLKVAFISLFWWVVIVVFSVLVAEGLLKNWLISFSNSILNLATVGLLIILIVEVVELRRALNGNN